MDRNAIDAMAGRLDRLERENRLLRRLGLVGLAGMLAAALAGATRQEGPGEVRATRFVLVGDDGTALGRWEPTPRGSSLELAGSDGSSRIVLGFPGRAMPTNRGFDPGLLSGRSGRMLPEQAPYPEIYFHDREGKVAYVCPPRLEVIPVR